MTEHRCAEGCGYVVASETGNRPSTCPQCPSDLERVESGDDGPELTPEERERIENDPVLELEDVQEVSG